MTCIENIEEALGMHEAFDPSEYPLRRYLHQIQLHAVSDILFKPDENYIPKIMNRIFAEYYKLYKKHNFIPGYEYLRMMDKPAAEETRQR